MKKTIAIVVSLTLIMILAGCSKSENVPEENDTGTVDTYEIDSEEAEPSDESDSKVEPSDEDTDVLSPEFKKTMDDYEA